MEDAIKVWREEGYEEGFKQGYEEGFKQGYEEGREEVRQRAMSLLEAGCSDEEIIKILEQEFRRKPRQR